MIKKNTQVLSLLKATIFSQCNVSYSRIGMAACTVILSQLLVSCWEVKTSSHDKGSTEIFNSSENFDSASEVDISLTQNDDEGFYDIAAWQKLEVTSLDIATVAERPAEIAKVITVDDNSLDFSSHDATKYRFMKSNAPYFDLVDSKKFLELHWYFANENDSSQEKQTSSSHAKKAHRFARQLMGDSGGNIVANMLFGQVTTNQTVNGIKVALARCQFYNCMLVLEKEANISAIAQEEGNTLATNTVNIDSLNSSQ